MADGLTTIRTDSVKETITKSLLDSGVDLGIYINPDEIAQTLDLPEPLRTKQAQELRPTEKPADLRRKARGGETVMAQQTAGIDLPLKALAWEDAGGKVWLAYNDPEWIAARHGITSPAAKTLAGALAALTKAAAGA